MRDTRAIPDLIKLPIALVTGLVLEGLTAPAMRLALVLIGTASPRGCIDLLKPRLERMAGVRLDNAHRSLERPRGATVTIGDDVVHVFDDLVYTPGIQKRLAGIVTGGLSSAMLAAIAAPHLGGRTVTVDTEELRRLDSVPGILLCLRLALDRQRGDDLVRVRVTEDEALRIFGVYIDRAGINRTSTDGGTFRATSLSRIHDDLIEPGVRDLWTAIEGHVIDATPVVPSVRKRGKAWSYIELTMTRTVKLPSVREMAAKQRAQDDYERRRFDGADPAKMRATGSVKSQQPGASLQDKEGAQ